MKYFLLGLFLLASSLWASDSLVVTVNDFVSQTGIWWPNKSRSSAPVVVWFHGGMTSRNCQKGLIAGRDLSEIFSKFIVVSVSACKENHWWTSQAVSVVDAALDSVARRRNFPVNEVSLVGISDGALGVLSYSISGLRSVKNRLLMSGDLAAVGEAQAVVNSLKLRSGRWRFLQGGADRLYSAERTVPWDEEFCKRVSVDCKLRFDPSAEHDWSYWKTNRMEWIRESLEN